MHSGLLGWDAGWYETIAREGYGPLGNQALRFFPAVPLLTHTLAWVPGLGDGPALLLLANAAALAATAMLYVLARRETGDPAVARDGPSGSSACCPPPSCSSWATPSRSCSCSPSAASSLCDRHRRRDQGWTNTPTRSPTSGRRQVPSGAPTRTRTSPSPARWPSPPP